MLTFKSSVDNWLVSIIPSDWFIFYQLNYLCYLKTLRFFSHCICLKVNTTINVLLFFSISVDKIVLVVHFILFISYNWHKMRLNICVTLTPYCYTTAALFKSEIVWTSSTVSFYRGGLGMTLIGIVIVVSLVLYFLDIKEIFT